MATTARFGYQFPVRCVRKSGNPVKGITAKKHTRRKAQTEVSRKRSFCFVSARVVRWCARPNCTTAPRQTSP